jgi:hypothetical protein
MIFILNIDFNRPGCYNYPWRKVEEIHFEGMAFFLTSHKESNFNV